MKTNRCSRQRNRHRNTQSNKNKNLDRESSRGKQTEKQEDRDKHTDKQTEAVAQANKHRMKRRVEELERLSETQRTSHILARFGHCFSKQLCIPTMLVTDTDHLIKFSRLTSINHNQQQIKLNLALNIAIIIYTYRYDEFICRNWEMEKSYTV